MKSNYPFGFMVGLQKFYRVGLRGDAKLKARPEGVGCSFERETKK